MLIECKDAGTYNCMDSDCIYSHPLDTEHRNDDYCQPNAEQIECYGLVNWWIRTRVDGNGEECCGAFREVKL